MTEQTSFSKTKCNVRTFLMCSLVDFSSYKISTSNYNSMDCVYSIH